MTDSEALASDPEDLTDVFEDLVEAGAFDPAAEVFEVFDFVAEVIDCLDSFDAVSLISSFSSASSISSNSGSSMVLSRNLKDLTELAFESGGVGGSVNNEMAG